MTTPVLTMSIQTLEVADDGAALRSIKPDSAGIYRGVPMAVLGKPSRNGLTYEVDTGMQAMTNPKTRFAMNIKDGNQEGEWGHPFNGKKDLNRVIYIDRTRLSHYICGIDFQRICDGKYILVRGDCGTSGPYGAYLRESFEDPNRNTAFSLRALTQRFGPGGMFRRIRAMVTFDAVDGPGFEEASKRYMADTESNEISVDDILALEDRKALFSTEAITDQEILDIFQTNEVRVMNQEVGVYDQKHNVFVKNIGGQARRTSAVHKMLGGLR